MQLASSAPTRAASCHDSSRAPIHKAGARARTRALCRTLARAESYLDAPYAIYLSVASACTAAVYHVHPRRLLHIACVDTDRRSDTENTENACASERGGDRIFFAQAPGQRGTRQARAAAGHPRPKASRRWPCAVGERVARAELREEGSSNQRSATHALRPRNEPRFFHRNWQAGVGRGGGRSSLLISPGFEWWSERHLV